MSPIAAHGPMRHPKPRFERFSWLIVPFLSLLFSTQVAAAQTIDTVAGNGTAGFSGDGGPATSAQLDAPTSLALDASGGLFIADDCNNRIRRLDLATDTITTVAGGVSGCGTGGFGGDGGPATSALLNAPAGVALDGHGSLFIAEQCNQRIRQVDLTTNTITTVAGSGSTGCGAGGFGGDGGPATSAQLFLPTDVVADGNGILFIADRGNHRIRKVDLAAGTITTVAGTGTPGFIGDGGPAISAQLSGPTGVALDAGGNLFITDKDNSRIRKVDLSGIITTVAGTGAAGFGGDGGPATNAQLNFPNRTVVDTNGTLFISDGSNSRIRRVDPSGTITTLAGTGTRGYSGDGGPAASAQFNDPFGLAVDASGALFVADESNHRVRVVAGIGAVRSLVALNPAHLWVGLRNSDDQGTQFDVKIELLHNGTPAAQGLQRCITGVTRNPSLATEAIVAFDPFAAVALNSGDVLALTVSTRIGTNADGSKCSGPGGSHNNATGLRLYYDAASRLSRFAAEITPDPSENLYLRSTGTACGGSESSGVTARTLDTTAPTATSAKCKNSGSVNFAGGNAYHVIGTWSVTVP